MSVKKFLIMVFIVNAIIFIPRFLLTPIIGEDAMNNIHFGGVIIYVLGSFIWLRHKAKQGHRLTVILPVTQNIPYELQEYNNRLNVAGFEQLGVLEYKALFLKGITVVYINRAKNLIAYASKSLGAKVRFSSYLEDGFDISTDYPHGTRSESNKIVVNVVKTSLETALEYHQYQVEQYFSKHGNPKKFETIQEILDWEELHELSDDVYKSVLKHTGSLYLRIFLGATIFTPILCIIILTSIYIILALLGYGGQSIMENWLIVVAVVAFLVSMAWAFKPMYKPETVEDRKKKEFA